MTYCMKDYENYLEKLKEIKSLGWVESHLHLREKPNFWAILEYGEERGTQDRSAHETRSSRMFRWLLDPNGTHQLGNIFAQKLIQLIGGDYTYQPGKNEAIYVTNEEKHIDVLYKDFSQKIVLAIEVKQYAEEGQSNGVSQLDRYEEYVKQHKGLHSYYVYLTPLKDKPSNSNWLPVGYAEFIKMINEVEAEVLVTSESKYIEDTKKIIADFKEDLQRSIDYLKKDNSYIKEALTYKEKQLTLMLAQEIQHDTDGKHYQQLVDIAQDEHLPIKDLIIIIQDYLFAQNHSPNAEMRILIRKIFNYLSGGKQLDTDLTTTYTVKATHSPIKPELIEKYGLIYDKIELTMGKGQGINIYCKDNEYRVYFSGDTHGAFPNDGIQSIVMAEKKRLPDAKHVVKGQFKVADHLVLEDKISLKNGADISLNELMEQHILVAIQELSDYIKEQ